MNILSAFALFAIILKCVVTSGDAGDDEFRGAVDREDFEWLSKNSKWWEERNDLLDYVIAKGAIVTVKLIQRVDHAKRGVLAALFDKGEGMIGGVLMMVDYDDGDLRHLTFYRRELAGSPEKFFRVLNKIKEQKWQEWAVQWGVNNLFKAGRHDLVVPLVNALGERTFRSKRLKDVAILTGFTRGVRMGNQDIVEKYYGHPAITSEWYAHMLYASWERGLPSQAFQFLLERADQGDLNEAKRIYASKDYEQFRQAIDEGPKLVPHAGSRHSRYVEKPEPIQVTFSEKGVPNLKGKDPTEVPIAGLSIPERMERAKRMREERLKNGTETGSSKI